MQTKLPLLQLQKNEDILQASNNPIETALSMTRL